jgi:hypothetical protein
VLANVCIKRSHKSHTRPLQPLSGGYKPLTRKPGQQAASRTAGSSEQQQLAPSFATLHFMQQPGKANLTVRLQQPNLVAEVGFILAVIKFAYPSLPVSGVSPIPFRSTDVLLQGKQHCHSLCLCLRCTYSFAAAVYATSIAVTMLIAAPRRYLLSACICSAGDDCRG